MFEENRASLTDARIAIVISGGMPEAVYASRELPDIRVELIDMDSAEVESASSVRRAERRRGFYAAFCKKIYG